MSQSMKFRPDIEGLRGIAVVLVVLFHCGVPGFSGGFIGVDVFFALSGYLITGLIVDEIQRNGRLSFRNFYARRVRRLLPAAGLVLVSTLLVGMVVYSPLELAAFAKSCLFAALYASNYQFMFAASNYFGADVASNPYLHTWSLAVEEQFYLFWPALIVLALSRKGRLRRLAAVLLAVCVLSLAGCIVLTRFRQPWAFFSLPSRAWEFALGGLACLLGKPLLDSFHKWMRPLGWLGLAAILMAGCFFSPATSFPGSAALLPVAGTTLALIAGASGVSSTLQSLLGSRVLQYLGRLSYSWYLWHWPVVLLATACFPGITWREKALGGAVALVLANLTFVLLESPVRFSRFLLARPALSLSLAVIVPAAGFSASHFVGGKAERALAEPDQQRLWLAAHDERVLYDSKCLTVARVSRVSECVFGDRSSSTLLVLFGDSHAEQWFPAVNVIAHQKHWRVVTLLKSSCPAARVDVYSLQLKGYDVECSAWRERALERIVQLQPAIVILAEKDQYVRRYPDELHPFPISPERFQDGMRSTLSYLDTHGLKTLVIADVPNAHFDVPTCLSRLEAHSLATHNCMLQRDSALNSDVRAAEAEAVQKLNSVRLIDFADVFCAGSSCRSEIDGQVVYRDTNHLTSTFAKSFASSLGEQMNALVRVRGN